MSLFCFESGGTMVLSRLSALLATALISLTLGGCGGGGSGSPASVLPSPVSPTVAVNLKQPFTDTGRLVSVGEAVSVTASGTVNNGQCGTTACTFSPAGEPWADCANLPPPAFIAPGLPCYSLIGKIGVSGTPFEIGANLQFTATTAGELYIGLNDNYFPDNNGTWSVAISP